GQRGRRYHPPLPAAAQRYDGRLRPHTHGSCGCAGEVTFAPWAGDYNHMWQRFTERARRVVFFAQEEAGRLGENYVSTEHLLLGLVRENDSVAARLLDKIGV